jgi:hypothetical protein
MGIINKKAFYPKMDLEIKKETASTAESAG